MDRALDATIAPVAVSQDRAVYTCNPGDCQGIDGLVVHAVAHPDSTTPKQLLHL